MGLFKRFTGTRRPANGTPKASATQLWDALLSLGGDDVPWCVRPAQQPEPADLVAEWRATPGPYRFHYMIMMRFDEARCEVVALDRMWSSDGPNGGGSYGQGGDVTQRAVGWKIERDENGKLRLAKDGSFNTRQMKDPLRDTVIAAGWTWRGRALAF